MPSPDLEQAERQVGVWALSVATFSGFNPAVEVQQRVQDVQRVARRAGDDHLADPGDLVVHGVGPRDAALGAEVLRRRGGGTDAIACIRTQRVSCG